MKTWNTVEPLGVPSLAKLVDPPDANSKEPPEDTAENVDETPLPQLNAPPLTPQLPLEEVIVKLEAEPEIVNVASVCVDHVPRDKSPPKVDPEWMALIVALAGIAPPVPVGLDEVVVAVGLGLPDLGGYFIPLEGHEPAFGALIGTNVPSIIDPFKLK